MNNFEFYNPVKVVFGPGQINNVGAEAAKIGKKALLVTYQEHVFFDELIEKITKQCKDNDVEIVPFYGITANPLIAQAKKGVDLCNENNIDFIIGLGGGSAMDAAKAIAAGVKYDKPLWNMVAARHDGSEVNFPHEALPMMMIPTLPATGSEMNCCGVITNEVTTEKSYFWDPCLYPLVSIVDPELTCSLPAYQSACGVADTISHVLEFYVNGLKDTYLNNRIQESVMLTCIEYGPKVLKNPNDISARSQLQWASIMAQNGISQPGNGWTPMHQIGHVLSARYNVAHGASLSIIMPNWMKVLNHKRPERYVTFATNVCKIKPDGKTQQQLIDAGIEFFENFIKNLGVPTTLGEVNIPASEINDIIADSVRISFGPDKMLSCVPPVSPQEATTVLETAV
ncbi:MAG: iron-containing alcohol dehydrogenase [Phycisphaerae bacterium]|nr:iron-containing alcohol dehydrogenase [Phycisphaerae bacterium]